MAGNADVRVGDLLQTSGVDGIYPPGLDVARVVKVDPRADSSFARIALVPTASADGVRHVLVLEPMAMQLLPHPLPSPKRRCSRAKSGDEEVIMPRGADQLLLPVNPLFLWFSIFAALVAQQPLPLGRIATLPTSLALVLT